MSLTYVLENPAVVLVLVPFVALVALGLMVALRQSAWVVGSASRAVRVTIVMGAVGGVVLLLIYAAAYAFVSGGPPNPVLAFAVGAVFGSLSAIDGFLLFSLFRGLRQHATAGAIVVPVFYVLVVWFGADAVGKWSIANEQRATENARGTRSAALDLAVEVLDVERVAGGGADAPVTGLRLRLHFSSSVEVTRAPGPAIDIVDVSPPGKTPSFLEEPLALPATIPAGFDRTFDVWIDTRQDAGPMELQRKPGPWVAKWLFEDRAGAGYYIEAPFVVPGG